MNGNSRPKVLIVDDTPENLDILMAALGERYAVIAARDGEKALQLARREPIPEAILLDIMMPGIDGYEVCRRLKGDPATREIPVLFLTALTDEGSELKGLELGAVDYIHKPISIPLVQARVASQVSLMLARRQLAEQVQMLTDAARLREDVEHIMRHDLKGPLNPVIGLSEMMLEAPNLDDEQRQELRAIHRAGLNMLDMVNRSLDLYKMETGDYHYQPALLTPAVLIGRVINDLAGLTERTGVEVAVEGEMMSTCFGDEMLGYSMFCNLIKNAVESSPRQGRVEVRIHDEGERLTVRIHNRGEVPQELRERFFDKFTTAGKSGGTGLGTYSARLMAETMLGTIEMRSEEHDGTTLTVRLPSKAAEREVVERLLDGEKTE